MSAPMVAPMAVQQNDNKTLAIILEIVGGIFGIFGIGWLVAGKTKVGLPLLIGSFVWAIIEIIGTIVTLGFGLLCFFPIDIIALIVSAIMLNNSFNNPGGQNVGFSFGVAPAAPVAPYQGYAPAPPPYQQTPPPTQPYQSAPQYPQNPPPPQYPQ